MSAEWGGATRLGHTEERLRALIEQASEGIFVADLEGRYTDVNTAGCEMLGCTREDIIGKTIMDLIPAHQAPALAESKALLLRGDVHVGEWDLRRKDGTWLPVEVSAKILPDGRWQGFVRDISERRRLEREQRFLAEVGAALGQSLDHEETLIRVAQLVVRDLADCCIVDLLEEDGRATRFKVLHRDPAMASFCRRLEQVRPDRPSFVREVFETGEPVLHAEVAPEFLASIAQNEEHLAVLRALGPRTAMVVPLPARGRILGTLALLSAHPTQRYDGRDLAFVIELAQRAAFALDNARLYEVARRATAARDDLLGVVAHDLRNPINAIHLAAEILQRRPDDLALTQQSAQTILRSSERAIRLIQDLLDVRRIEAGHLALERRALAPSGVIAEAIEAQRQLAEAASIALRVELPAAPPEVWADPDRVQQLFENLLGNALKFTPAGGTITVGAREQDKEVLFWVRDTGMGIPAEALPNVFDRFWQAQKSARQGVGLGLAIVKGIVEAHGGRIWAESAVREGAKFSFTLPRVSASHAAASTASRPKRVLIVDDDRQALSALALILADEGLQIVTADTTQEALSKLILFTPDVLVTDLRFPDGDGLQLIDEVRRRLPEIPVILMTGMEDARALLGHNMAHVAKPINVDELVCSIRGGKYGNADGAGR